ncbi:MAG TPA: PilZ domain-containing protein [Terriglobales bacterium]|nr:PilZ domain-containing protein [Terriglobales bacterium]
MKLKALVMCRNPQTVRFLGDALEKFKFRQDCCNSAQEAIELIARGNYAIFILDFDLPEAGKAAKFAHMTPEHRRPVIFGMIGATTELQQTLRCGVNFPLYKPLQSEQLLHSIRAAYGFVCNERRRASRHAVETVVYLIFGKRVAIPTLMVNLSEEGFCVQAVDPLPTFENVDVHFLLPGTKRAIEGKAELVWTDSGGRAGMFLSEMTIATQRFLRNWLERRGEQNQRQSRVKASPAPALA